MHDNRLIRLVYNHNPFYLISACLVLYGARTSISSGHSDVGSDLWSLATILAGCTVVMAITAFLIVRFGRVWDDARSIFMVLLLMFFAISVSFDELLLTDTHLAITMLAAGFAFSLIVTELIVISLRIKFPLKYRLPYYLLLSLTFFYPLVFAADTAWNRTLNTRWLLLLFPAITGLTILSLLPAIRAGSKLVDKNGTPWSWPMYPWSIFVFLIVGLAGRSVMLCLAFEPSPGMSSIWGLYFLAPIAFSIGVLLLEIGIVERKPICRQMGLGAAFLAIPLTALIKPDDSSMQFVSELIGAVGSPVWMSSVLLLILYTVAWLRQVERSEIWLTAMLVICIFVDRRLLNISVEPVTVWPVFCIAGYQLLLGLRARCSRRLLVASLFVSIGIGLAMLDTNYADFALVAGLHAMLIGMLVTGVFCKDVLASQLNAISAGLLVLYSVIAACSVMADVIDAEMASVEIGAMGLFGVLCWKLNRDRLFAFSAAASAVVGLLFNAPHLVADLTSGGQQRLITFLWIALLCFAVGVFISSLKAGLSKYVRDEATRLSMEIKRRFVIVEKPIRSYVREP